MPSTAFISSKKGWTHLGATLMQQFHSSGKKKFLKRYLLPLLCIICLASTFQYCDNSIQRGLLKIFVFCVFLHTFCRNPLMLYLGFNAALQQRQNLVIVMHVQEVHFSCFSMVNCLSRTMKSHFIVQALRPESKSAEIIKDFQQFLSNLE